MWLSHKLCHIHHNRAAPIFTPSRMSVRHEQSLENSSLLSDWSSGQSQHMDITAASLSQSSAASLALTSPWRPASSTWLLLRQWHHCAGTSHNSSWCAPALSWDAAGNDSDSAVPWQRRSTDWGGEHADWSLNLVWSFARAWTRTLPASILIYSYCYHLKMVCKYSHVCKLGLTTGSLFYI